MLNAGAISVLTDRVRAEGDTTVQLQARGTVARARPRGHGDAQRWQRRQRRAQHRCREHQRRHHARGPRIVLTQLNGDVNGGTLEGSGTVTLGDGGIADIDMRVATKDFAYDAPLDLRSLTDSEIRITTSRTRTSWSAAGSRSWKPGSPATSTSTPACWRR